MAGLPGQMPPIPPADPTGASILPPDQFPPPDWSQFGPAPGLPELELPVAADPLESPPPAEPGAQLGTGPAPGLPGLELPPPAAPSPSAPGYAALADQTAQPSFAQGGPAPASWTGDDLGIDAVSGGEPAPAAPDAPKPQFLSDPVTAHAEELARDPERLAMESADLAQRQAQDTADKQLQAISDDRVEARRNFLDRQAADAKTQRKYDALLEDAKTLAATKTDPERWWSNRSVGQKIAGFVGAAISGYLNPGGKNQTIETAMQAIDQDLDAQAQDMANQRHLLGMRGSALEQEFQRTGDLYQAKETMRLAAYAQVDEKLAAEQVKFDPAGSRAIAIASERRKVQAQIAEAKAKAAKEMFEREQKIIETDRKERELQAQIRHQKATERQAAYATSSAARTATASRDADMLGKGFVPDKKSPGGYRLDPGVLDALRKADPKAAAAAVELELKQEQLDQTRRGAFAQNAKGQEIGRARFGTDDAKMITMQVGDYETFREISRELAILADENRVYGGIGSDRWPAAAKTKADTLISGLAVRLAKIRDPASVAREGEVEIAKRDMPKMKTFLSNRNPMSAYEALSTEVDTAMTDVIRGRVIDPNPAANPVLRHKARDQAFLTDLQADKPEEIRARAATPPSALALGTDELRRDFVEGKKRLYQKVFERGGADASIPSNDAMRAEIDAMTLLTPDERNELRDAADKAWHAAKLKAKKESAKGPVEASGIGSEWRDAGLTGE